jgi:hypothetical protein
MPGPQVVPPPAKGAVAQRCCWLHHLQSLWASRVCSEGGPRVWQLQTCVHKSALSNHSMVNKAHLLRTSLYVQPGTMRF